MALTSSPTLVSTITLPTGASAATTNRFTAFFSRRQRPWLAGYRARVIVPAGVQSVTGATPNPIEVQASGAARLAACDTPMDATRRTAFGVNGGAAAQTFDVPSGFVALPFSTGNLSSVDITTLLTAIMIRYAPKDRANAVVVPRAPTGGTLVAGEWKTDDTNTVSIFTPASNSPYTIYELLVPDTANIYNPVVTTELASAVADGSWTSVPSTAERLAVVADFMAARYVPVTAGITAPASVTLARVFR